MPSIEAHDDWTRRWLTTVVDGSATMSQRRLSSIERHGGVDAATALARQLGVHLLQVTDDRGHVLVAASRHPFKVLA